MGREAYKSCVHQGNNSKKQWHRIKVGQVRGAGAGGSRPLFCLQSFQLRTAASVIEKREFLAFYGAGDEHLASTKAKLVAIKFYASSLFLIF